MRYYIQLYLFIYWTTIKHNDRLLISMGKTIIIVALRVESNVKVANIIKIANLMMVVTIINKRRKIIKERTSGSCARWNLTNENFLVTSKAWVKSGPKQSSQLQEMTTTATQNVDTAEISGLTQKEGGWNARVARNGRAWSVLQEWTKQKHFVCEKCG